MDTLGESQCKWKDELSTLLVLRNIFLDLDCAVSYQYGISFTHCIRALLESVQKQNERVQNLTVTIVPCMFPWLSCCSTLHELGEVCYSTVAPVITQNWTEACFNFSVRNFFRMLNVAKCNQCARVSCTFSTFLPFCDNTSLILKLNYR